MKLEWYGPERMEQWNRAAELGLARAADTVRSEVVRTLRKTTGTATGKANNGRGRNIYAASLPGTPPGSRSGRLRGSIEAQRAGTLRWRVGTNLVYARILELGGTINHPGGTDYIVTSQGAVFIGKAKAEQLRTQGYWVGKTKPHPIKMPRRPYLVPTLKRLEESGQIQRSFNGAFRKALKGGGA